MWVPYDDDDCYIRLRDIFWVPVGAFGTTTWGTVEDDQPPYRVMSDTTRVGTLPDDQIDLLQLKLLAFWTDYQPEDIGDSVTIS